MSENFLLANKSITGEQHLLIALQHNKRIFFSGASPGNIDSTKSPLNYVIGSDVSPREALKYVKERISNANLKIRKNGIMAIEMLFSLPPSRHKQDTADYFFDCYAWLEKEFSCEILSFDVHLDEAAPHAHALVFPLLNGRMCGSDLQGGRGEMYARNDSFHSCVASKYGLSKPERLYGRERQDYSDKVLSVLNTDPIKDSRVYTLVKSSIECNPLPFVKFLGLQREKFEKKKSFAKYMTAKGKGSKEHDGKEIKSIDTLYTGVGYGEY